MATTAEDAGPSFRLLLESNAIWSRMVSTGDRVPDLPLIEADLGPIHLDRLRATGPVVLMFFRHAGSPECGAALRMYRDALAPRLSALGAHLVAVSPQEPGRLEAVKRRHDLDFFVASDPRHALIDAFNIGYSSPGADTTLGTGRSVLPFATVVVADRAGIVQFTDVHADWSTRTNPEHIVAAISHPGRKPPASPFAGAPLRAVRLPKPLGHGSDDEGVERVHHRVGDGAEQAPAAVAGLAALDVGRPDETLALHAGSHGHQPMNGTPSAA